MNKAIFLLILGLLLPTSPSQAAPDGADLYGRHCAACHGERGDGGIGIPISLPSFHQTVDDDYLRLTIRLGRPGRVMPGFASLLKEDEIEAIVRHLRSWYPGKPPSFKATRIKGDPKHGAALFEKHCAGCHGPTGEGAHGTGVTFSRPRDFPVMPPAIRNPGYLASAKDEMIKATLVHGRTGTPMVSFAKRGLKDKDINDIVAFIRSLEKRPQPESAKVLEADKAIISAESPYDLKTTVENIKRAIGNNNFVLIREQPLNDGVVAESQVNPKQHVIYFCNFSMLNQALATDPRVGLFLPCRITVTELNGKVTMMAVNPKRLSEIFNNSELNDMCDQVTKMYQAVMEEAAI